MYEASPSNNPNEPVFDIDELVSRVQNGQIANMTGAEIDALDEAIELRIVDEAVLRLPGGQDAQA